MGVAFSPELVGVVKGGGFFQDAWCQMGMSKQSHEPGVVLGYKECGHIDVSQRAPFIEEKRFTEPKEAE